MVYNKLIKQRRLKLCWSQADLLNALDYNPKFRSRVCNWETGKHVPNYQAARDLAAILGGEASDYRDETGHQGSEPMDMLEKQTEE